ncbi:DNA-directed RNA polymerase III subunit RPC5 [Fopius arisanus]|uniref:DNA-directed RNA polymerase III subunit RPC5 n=1 Tax=Fopius arisanus TaxID=64838 RepID=A0A0C9Q5H0_9HYME|nr:PREDICTED: DNA-directed RNA polymerase III subunit RPC5 [Fopius arisanus]
MKMESSSSMDTDDDPVVNEIPVYLSKTLADKLFIFQYPIRPAGEGYDNAEFLKTAIKPENQEVRIEVGIDIGGPNYDHRKGEWIVENSTSESIKTKEKLFDGHMMDKIVLQSSRALPDCSNYAVGVFQDGELHVTPLKGIIQLRPQFNYLDMSDKNAKDDTKKAGEEEPEEEAKQVNVTFARQKSELAQKRKEQSFQEQAKKSSEEEWITSIYRNISTTQSELTRLEMLCALSDDRSNNLRLPPKDYVKLLAPPAKSDDYSKATAHDSSSLNYVRTLPLLDQIKIIMKDARILSFIQLRSIISSEHETSAILKYLQQVAVLVQGNWIVNSELIYPVATKSSHNGIPAELMCRARDYILLSFTESEFVDRKAVSSVVRLPPEEIKEIFTNLARIQPKKGWQLILPSSTEFQARYPEIAQRQQLFWEAKRKHLKDVMEAPSQPPQRQRRKSNRESIGSENEERNVGRGRHRQRDSSMSDDGTGEPVKSKKGNRGKKVSETT